MLIRNSKYGQPYTIKVDFIPTEMPAWEFVRNGHK